MGELTALSPPGATVRGARHLWVISAGLVLLTTLAFSPVVGNDFLYAGDHDVITGNPHVVGGLIGANFRWAWVATDSGRWQPLTWLSLQLDATLFGRDARGFHLTNLALHSASVLLLFHLLARLSGSPGPSAAVAALFAVHPMHVEPVAWAAERGVVLGVFFLLLSVTAYAAFVRRPSPGGYVVLLLCFALGLLAAPWVAVLPGVLLLLDAWPLRRRAAEPAPPWAALVVEKGVLLALALGHVMLAGRIEGGGDTFSPPASVAAAYAWHLGKALVPTRLALFYPALPELPAAYTVLAGAVLAAVTLALAWGARRRPELLVGWLWFLLTLAPAVVRPLPDDAAYTCRSAYVPHIGLFVTLVWGAAGLVRRLRIPAPLTAVAAAAVLVACAALTFAQARRWRDPNLWEYTFDVAGPSYPAHFHLGVHHVQRNDLAEASRHFRAALAHDPARAPAHVFLGKILLAQGEARDAEEHFRQALQHEPTNLSAPYHLAQALFEQGDRLAEAGALLEELLPRAQGVPEVPRLLGCVFVRDGLRAQAIPHFRHAVELSPDDVDTRLWLAQLLGEVGEWQEAEAHCRAAAEHSPDSPQPWETLGRTLVRQQRWAEAAAAFRQALTRAPTSVAVRGDLALALYEQGARGEAEEFYGAILAEDPAWAKTTWKLSMRLSTHQDAAERDGLRAWELATQLWQASGEKDLSALEARAAAEAEIGRFDRAVADTQRALDLAGNDRTLRQRLETRRERFLQKRPIRIQQ